MKTKGNQARQDILESLTTDEPLLLQSILDSIHFYEDKYGGTFLQTLGKKDFLTRQEQLDAADWSYFLSFFDTDQ
ncbi:hypothetical protein LSG31_22240 [Fodinisporobacter ferrooxydans]|uniref:Uncharacterized protein n=1 Tax=Fodinisporobacter ferrooxydans TaxID=2901836 RepID=A0ABY4CJ56_9BACL|nr:hypothetical protein LSG31_22240 [Alicyclobacillaceae bacterium MYW30-H2]